MDVSIRLLRIGSMKETINKGGGNLLGGPQKKAISGFFCDGMIFQGWIKSAAPPGFFCLWRVPSPHN